MSTLIVGATCAGCGASLAPYKRHGRPRKWCSDDCRKQTCYGGTPCADCGTPLRYTGRPSRRCTDCSHKAEREAAVWTREVFIVEAFRWYRLVGSWPTATDWAPQARRSAALQEAWEAFTSATGPWPWQQDAQHLFGSWAAFMDAVGGTSSGRGAGRLSNAELRAKIAALKAATP